MKEKIVIGWSEIITFPGWEIPMLKVKVDTGARTSALHVENLKKIDGGKRVTFDVILDDGSEKEITADVLKWAKVRSSTGVYTKRAFVRTRVKIGSVEKDIDVTLVNRQKMVFRMLLGRKALEKDFIVDVSKRNALLEGRRKTNPAPKKKPVPKGTSNQDKESE